MTAMSNSENDITWSNPKTDKKPSPLNYHVLVLKLSHFVYSSLLTNSYILASVFFFLFFNFSSSLKRGSHPLYYLYLLPMTYQISQPPAGLAPHSQTSLIMESFTYWFLVIPPFSLYILGPCSFLSPSAFRKFPHPQISTHHFITPILFLQWMSLYQSLLNAPPLHIVYEN